ncbi:hypothetical protein SAMN06296065_10212 [Novosphingobium panipatense]|uniref:Uncharacterized protein n=1 Tax=Novosphingobium panipatense TaxID=428991 RepID=A0ABY1Q0I6_9SPHN|nr:hypothetical protein SAMN06296065_10212 [Novosphingobium panipatense]
MAWLARLLLLVPAIVAGWFVSREDPRYWVIAMVVALVFLALTCVAAIYAPRLSIVPRRHGKRRGAGTRTRGR